MRLDYYHKHGVARHQGGEVSKWAAWACADRILSGWQEREPYPAKFLNYCSALMLSPKYVARMVRGYRLYKELRWVWSDTAQAQLAAAFGYPWQIYHPRSLRRNGVTLRHYMVVAEAGRGLHWSEMLKELKMCLDERLSADGLRDYLSANGRDDDEAYEYEVWQGHVRFFEDNLGYLPEDGRELLVPFIRWWNKWEQ